MKRLLLPFVLLIFCSQSGFAQTSFVYQRLRSVMNGKVDEVRSELAEMAKDKDVSDNPGLLFLQGVVMDDGAKACSIYERITQDFPESEWADDAQLRVVQYYALRRDTARAQRELANFKRSYPLSEYLIYAHDLVKATVGVSKNPNTAISAAASPAAKSSSTSASALSGTTVTAKATMSEKKDEGKEGAKEVLRETTKESTKESAKESTSQSKESSPAISAKAFTEKTSFDEKKFWGWQVGVYSTRKTAESEAQTFKESRMRVDVIEKEGKFAVVVGHYSAKDSAEKSKSLVEAQCSCVPYLIEKPQQK